VKLLWVPVVLFAAFCFRVGRRIARKLRVLQAQLAAYRRGDYEGQLAAVEGFRVKGSEPTEYLFFRGSACLQLGRLAEAEQMLRRCLPLETNSGLRTICRDELGRVLMAQERWEEAEECFQKCLAEAPRRGSGHRAVAELLLRRGERAGEALEAAQRAVDFDSAEKLRASQLAKDSRNANLAESLAILAWALATNRRDPADVNRTIEEAFAFCGTDKPILAELHFFSGQACAESGDSAASSRHFQAAAETDPAGYYGRLSRSKMVSIA
jgi:tetratricopeptide (TPR) repeat protein